MARTGLVYDPLFLRHRVSDLHPEQPARLEAVIAALQQAGLLKRVVRIEPCPAEHADLVPIHSPEYIRRVEQACMRGRQFLDSLDTEICPDSFQAAKLAAGAVIAAAGAVAEGKIDNAFCAVRPPGHHAVHDRAMGFCIFNSVAVATRYLQRAHGVERVLIVDFDVHHGNGTQDAFYGDDTVFYFSMHRYPFYPGTGAAHETGEGKAKDCTLNVPLPAGSDDDVYEKVLNRILRPAADRFRPGFLMLSAGFDPHYADPLGGMQVTEAGFRTMLQLILEIARQHCGGKLVSVIEGGYNLHALAVCACDHVRLLLEA